MIRFFETGYQAGHSEGEALGQIEGFQLGLASAFKIWEELGYYSGQLQLWNLILHHPQKDQTRILKLKFKTDQLQALIEDFPTQNQLQSNNEEGLISSHSQADMVALLNAIRSKYKICCASMGIKPRIQAVSPLAM